MEGFYVFFLDEMDAGGAGAADVLADGMGAGLLSLLQGVLLSALQAPDGRRAAHLLLAVLRSAGQ